MAVVSRSQTCYLLHCHIVQRASGIYRNTSNLLGSSRNIFSPCMMYMYTSNRRTLKLMLPAQGITSYYHIVEN